jgi:hypothetical protein
MMIVVVITVYIAWEKIMIVLGFVVGNENGLFPEHELSVTGGRGGILLLLLLLPISSMSYPIRGQR